MTSRARPLHGTTLATAFAATMILAGATAPARAQPAVLDPALQVTSAVDGLVTPIGFAFIGANDMLVPEKETGRVRRAVNGTLTGTVLDLAVNRVGQRGLLGMALSPSFASDGKVFVYWTESSTGADTSDALAVPLLGNRVDRFTWDGTSLTFDANLIRMRALQDDPLQAPGTSNNGGALRFGPDGKLYVSIGDVGRRGWYQNLPGGPTPPGSDDAFGGPQPDNAHLTGAVLRLDPDGAAPADNPFFAVGAAIGGEVGANVQKTFAYGFRNSFGMAFDPATGKLWAVDNGDDAFDEINQVAPGSNGDWIQFMGPLSRFDDFKAIEAASANGLGQVRYPAASIAADAATALSGTFLLPGATHLDPELSWLHAIAPSALGFQVGDGIGTAYDGAMFVGAGTLVLDDGYLLRLSLDAARNHLDLSGDPALADKVADNAGKFDGTQSETLRFGTGFGVVTDIRTGPDGLLYVASLTRGAIYVIAPADDAPVPAPATAGLLATGLAVLRALRRRTTVAR